MTSTIEVQSVLSTANSKTITSKDELIIIEDLDSEILEVIGERVAKERVLISSSYFK